MILSIIEILLLSIFGFFMLYLAGLSFLAMIAPKLRLIGIAPSRRFAVVVPAHNEEQSLAKTVRSILKVDYPNTHYDVIVIADNCTDSTAKLGKKEGAMVLERTNPLLRGKGYALRWCFDIILSKESQYDAVVVIDADSIISKNYLSVMNNYLEQGSRAIQSSDMVEPQPGSWSSEIIRLGFTLYNHVRPLGRKVLHCSAGIRGNGMCFSTETLKSVPWSSYSLNEDLEYGLILLMNGINVDFAPEVNVWATMPTNKKNAESQRERWEKGRFPVIRKYGLKLLSNAISKFSLRSLDAFLDLIIPPFVNLFSAISFFFIVNVLLTIAGIETMLLWTLLWAFIILLGITHVLVGLAAAHADKDLYRSFFHIPQYALWKFLLYLRLIQRESSEEWIRTIRD